MTIIGQPIDATVRALITQMELGIRDARDIESINREAEEVFSFQVMLEAR